MTDFPRLVDRFEMAVREYMEGNTPCETSECRKDELLFSHAALAARVEELEGALAEVSAVYESLPGLPLESAPQAELATTTDLLMRMGGVIARAALAGGGKP